MAIYRFLENKREQRMRKERLILVVISGTEKKRILGSQEKATSKIPGKAKFRIQSRLVENDPW